MSNPLRRFADVIRAEARAAQARPILATALLLVFVSLAFLALPRLDFVVSGLFYDRSAAFSIAARASSTWCAKSDACSSGRSRSACSLPLVLKLVFPQTQPFVRPRQTLFVLASLALGPGLIVNGILKAFWGRARPRQILEFGGDAIYSPVWWISDQCSRNCSFVSGEAASAIWLMALVFLVPREWKRPVAIATIAVAAVVSLARVAAGGHFLSDVLIAWTIVLLVLALLSRLILEGLPPAFDTKVESAVGAAGMRLRALVERLVG